MENGSINTLKFVVCFHNNKNLLSPDMISAYHIKLDS